MKNDKAKTKAQLVQELSALRGQAAELEALQLQRRQTEQALRESEERYRSLFEESGGSIVIATLDGMAVDVNRAWTDLFGFTREEIIGTNFRHLHVNAADQDRMFQEAEQKGFVKDFEIKVRRKDGREIYGQVTNSIRRASDGTYMGRQVITRDITERKRAAALAEVVRELANTLDYHAVAQKIANSVCALLGVRIANVFRLAPGTGDLVSLGVSGTGVSAFGERLVLPYGTGVSALAVRERQPVFTADLLADPRITYSPEDRARMEQTGARAALAVPLLVQDRVMAPLLSGTGPGGSSATKRSSCSRASPTRRPWRWGTPGSSRRRGGSGSGPRRSTRSPTAWPGSTTPMRSSTSSSTRPPASWASTPPDVVP